MKKFELAITKGREQATSEKAYKRNVVMIARFEWCELEVPTSKTFEL